MLGKDRSWLCVDNDSTILAKAKSILPESNIEFMQLDLTNQMSSLTPDCSAAITVPAFVDMIDVAFVDIDHAFVIANMGKCFARIVWAETDFHSLATTP